MVTSSGPHTVNGDQQWTTYCECTHAVVPLFPSKLKSKLGVDRRSEIIFFSFFHHSVFPTCFFLFPFLFNTVFFLPFTVSLSLRIVWGITLSSLFSKDLFFFYLVSLRILRFKYTAFCGFYSVIYS
jgi:hypothetical protein